MALTVPEKHELKIAKRTLKLHREIVAVLGGPTHAEARATIRRLTGRTPARCGCCDDN